MNGKLTEPKSTVQNLHVSNLLLRSDASDSLSRENRTSEQELDEQPKKRKQKQLKSNAHENSGKKPKRKRKQLKVCISYTYFVYHVWNYYNSTTM